ncbi:DUF4339 domain-containing protein [Bradyrhizobium tropiciagri]|uniref:DUF4339 domain-containing protein n=1 Tax=Bradyrhizobium tropiciagri TaxID=312253 RepID=UPI001BA74A29|nr:DUF4339 domain-containing protein [Bradyrhizobium tropiciagri]
MTEEVWYISRNGQQLGPMTRPQIDEFHSANKLAPADLVWTASLGEWKPASSVFRFAAGAVPPPPPPPVPAQSQPSQQTTIVEGGSFKFGTFVWVVLGLCIPMWPISLPICWFFAYRSYKKPSIQTVRTITH